MIATWTIVLGKTGLASLLSVPLITREKVIGVIFVFRNYPGIFSANDRALLQSFANQAAIAVDNAQLYQQVSQDKQRVDALIDSAADGILILSPGHNITRCNPAFARMLGEPMADIVGQSHDKVIELQCH